jgi:hypothetical protein
MTEENAMCTCLHPMFLTLTRAHVSCDMCTMLLTLTRKQCAHVHSRGAPMRTMRPSNAMRRERREPTRTTRPPNAVQREHVHMCWCTCYERATTHVACESCLSALVGVKAHHRKNPSVATITVSPRTEPTPPIIC